MGLRSVGRRRCLGTGALGTGHLQLQWGCGPWAAGDAVQEKEVTVFDLEAKTVRGARDGASDIIRHLLFKYGMVFEPRLWRQLGPEDRAKIRNMCEQNISDLRSEDPEYV